MTRLALLEGNYPHVWTPPHDSEVAVALSGLADDLEARHAGSGWTRQNVSSRIAVFTRPVGLGQYFVTVEVLHVGRVTRHEKWPAQLCLRYGCGHGATMALMPSLGLDPDPVLVEEPVTPESPRFFAEIIGSTDIARVVEQLHREITAHQMDFATSLTNDVAMERALRDDQLTPPGVRAELLPALLAATGNTTKACQVAEQCLDEQDADDRDDYAEFVRLLHKFADTQ